MWLALDGDRLRSRTSRNRSAWRRLPRSLAKWPVRGGGPVRSSARPSSTLGESRDHVRPGRDGRGLAGGL